MRDHGVFLSKWPHQRRIILAKEQLCHSYIFWTMPILIFCQFAYFGNQSLDKDYKSVTCSSDKTSNPEITNSDFVFHKWVCFVF